ncbi:MBL fold metallo-hydrolase [Gordonia liuliyuniae]|uniref:MBL fold metallo-hydrolase n=1 Tax=Gordonia liuliyuniae TaxID=2911517 RepID=UPI0027E0370D|nr:MBL fold metallo-hydrolase [Gordonia liuliyuniae]
MTALKVHHLNCGTMRPLATPGGLVCHVLLVETPTGLALVDTGLGLRYGSEPGKLFGPSRFVVRPVFDEAEAAVRQVQALGFDPHDVRDIVLTHFDADHVGGIADFPWARIHLTGDEANAALTPRTFAEKSRYLPAQRDHRPELVRHEPAAGDQWRGFASATELTEIGDGIVMLALPGHSRGHAAIAVDAGHGRWVLHAGDSFYHSRQIGGHGKAPLGLLAMERTVAFDWPRVRENHERLRELLASNAPGLQIVNAHDPTLLAAARESSGQRG